MNLLHNKEKSQSPCLTSRILDDTGSLSRFWWNNKSGIRKIVLLNQFTNLNSVLYVVWTVEQKCFLDLSSTFGGPVIHQVCIKGSSPHESNLRARHEHNVASTF